MPGINERMATCPLKQFIRENLWEKYIAKLNKRPIKYLTLYCPPLTDVKHLVRKGYINFSGGVYQGVVGVTLPDRPNDPNGNERAYASAISEGKGRLEYLGRESTSQLIKSRDQGFINHFPFDVINLDYCNFIFGDENNQYLSGNLEDIVEIILQQERNTCNKFVLFVTTRTDKNSPRGIGFAGEFVDELTKRIQLNIDKLSGFKEKYKSVFDRTTPAQLYQTNYNYFIAIGIVKLISMILAQKKYTINDCNISWLERNYSPARELHLMHLALLVESGRYTRKVRTLGQAGYFAYLEKGAMHILDRIKNKEIDSVNEKDNFNKLERRYGSYLKELREDTFEIRPPTPIPES